MTESEAIEAIRFDLEMGGEIHSSVLHDAMDVAIQVLEKQMKKENADGCAGCAFEDVEEWEMPCRKCNRNCKDYYRAKEDK